MIPAQQYQICLLVFLKAASEKGNVACVKMEPLLEKIKHSSAAAWRNQPSAPLIMEYAATKLLQVYYLEFYHFMPPIYPSL